jgi:ferredoxin
MMNKVTMEILIDKETCVGCGICIDLFPADEPVLELIDDVAEVTHLENCQECEACAVNCEYGSVSYIE